MTKLSELQSTSPAPADEVYVVQGGASRRARIGDLPVPDLAASRLATLETVAHSHDNSAVLDATSASFTVVDRVKLDGIEPGATSDPTGAEIVAALDGALDGPAWRAVAPVASVNGRAGAVVLTAGDLGAATAAQGALAEDAAPRAALAAVAFSGAFGDLAGAPTRTGALINDGAGEAGTAFVIGRAGGVARIERLTQAAYDALAAPDPATLYVIDA